MLAPNEQEGMEEEQEELKVEQELPIKLYNGHRTGEGTLMNPAFFPNLMQLHQPNMNSGMSMPNMDYGAFPMQPPLEFLFGPACESPSPR
jgi:hypothetical protein